MEPQETTPNSTENTPASSSQPTNIIAAIATSVAMIAIALAIILHPGTKGESPSTAATTDQPAAADSKPIPTDIAMVRPGDANYTRGNIDTAQVLVFEYSDSDCPYCVKFHPTLQQVVADYKGKVAWVYRFLPLEMHPNAYNEAVALSCAGQLGGAKAFNSYLDSVINVTLNADAKSNELLTTIAVQQGLDASKFKSCFASPETKKIVDADIADAANIGAQGTPFSVVVNKTTGKQVTIPGAYPIDEVKKMIDSVL